MTKFKLQWWHVVVAAIIVLIVAQNAGKAPRQGLGTFATESECKIARNAALWSYPSCGCADTCTLTGSTWYLVTDSVDSYCCPSGAPKTGFSVSEGCSCSDCSLSSTGDCPQLGPVCMPDASGNPSNILCTDTFMYHNGMYCDVATLTCGTSCVGTQGNAHCETPSNCVENYETCCSSDTTCGTFDTTGDPYKCTSGAYVKKDTCTSTESCVVEAFEARCSAGGFYCYNSLTNTCTKNSDTSCYSSPNECNSHIVYYCLNSDRTQCTKRFESCQITELSYSGSGSGYDSITKNNCESDIGSGGSACKDSIDKGKNYAIKGTTIGKYDDPILGTIDISNPDSCSDLIKLKEYYCIPSSNEVKEEIHTCESGTCTDGACVSSCGACSVSCPTGTCSGTKTCQINADNTYECKEPATCDCSATCTNGKCTGTKTCQSGECKESPALCIDVDGGKIYTIAGITETPNSGLDKWKADFCDVSIDFKTLKEYYCDSNGKRQEVSYSCPSGSCKTGKFDYKSNYVDLKSTDIGYCTCTKNEDCNDDKLACISGKCQTIGTCPDVASPNFLDYFVDTVDTGDSSVCIPAGCKYIDVSAVFVPDSVINALKCCEGTHKKKIGTIKKTYAGLLTDSLEYGTCVKGKDFCSYFSFLGDILGDDKYSCIVGLFGGMMFMTMMMRMMMGGGG